MSAMFKSFLSRLQGSARSKSAKKKRSIKHRQLTNEKLENREVFDATGNTVGLLETAHPDSFGGYTLISPSNSTKTYLIDMDGQKVHEWQSPNNPMDTHLEMYDVGGTSLPILFRMNRLPDGDLSDNDPPVQRITAPGAGGQLEARDWDNHLLWSFDYQDPDHRMHHDFETLPNGNIIFISWQYHTRADAIANGRDPATIATTDNASTQADEASLWSDSIVEIDPQFDADTTNGVEHTATVVWQWNLWDHLIQNTDPNLPNYGDPAQHPEKIDINYFREGFGEGSPSMDWNHFNGLDYNPALDQIIVSSRELSEAYIIDHSTTTAQAATGRGGDAAHGGDILYRVGNPAAYSKGTFDDQFFSYQHNPQWIDPGLPGAGQVMVFNNGWNRPDAHATPTDGYSTIEQFKTPINNKWFLSDNNNTKFQTQFTAPIVAANWIPVTGDWNGDGKDTIGLYNPRTATWYLNNKTDGSQDDVYTVHVDAGKGFRPVVGDWDGDGSDSIGFYNPATRVWALYNMDNGAVTDAVPKFKIDNAPANGRPLAGNWDGQGGDGVGIYNPATHTWMATNTLTSKASFEISFTTDNHPDNTWRPVAGDWNGDGKDTFGIYNPKANDWYLNNTMTATIDPKFLKTINGPNAAVDTFLPIVGDYDGDGDATIGLYDPTVKSMYKLGADGVYGHKSTYRYTATPDKNSFYAPIISNAQRLPNGNTFINEGTDGRSFEVNPAGQIVWAYKNPITVGTTAVNQQSNPPPLGAFPNTFLNLTFRTYRYGTDFAGFVGKDLTPKGHLEGPGSSGESASLTGSSDDTNDEALISLLDE